jgi:hypothetical protein
MYIYIIYVLQHTHSHFKPIRPTYKSLKQQLCMYIYSIHTHKHTNSYSTHTTYTQPSQSRQIHIQEPQTTNMYVYIQYVCITAYTHPSQATNMYVYIHYIYIYIYIYITTYSQSFQARQIRTQEPHLRTTLKARQIHVPNPALQATTGTYRPPGRLTIIPCRNRIPKTYIRVPKNRE